MVVGSLFSAVLVMALSFLLVGDSLSGIQELGR
jgi:hypothetical protein